MKKFIVTIFLLLFSLPVIIFAQAQSDSSFIWESDKGPNSYEGNFWILPDGNIIVNNDSRFFLLDGATGKTVKEFPLFTDSAVGLGTIDVSRDGNYLLTYSFRYAPDGMNFIHKVHIYDLMNEDVFDSFVIEGGKVIRFLPDSKTLIILTAYTNGEYIKYDIETKEEIIGNMKYDSDTKMSDILAISGDGNYLALKYFKKISSSPDKFNTYIDFIDTETYKPVKQLAVFKGQPEIIPMSRASFSPDGKYFGLNIENKINIFDTEDISIIYNDEYSWGISFLPENWISYQTIIFPDPKRFISFLNLNRINEGEIMEENISERGGTYTKYNSKYSSIVYDTEFYEEPKLYKRLIALDFNKIITGIDYTDRSIQSFTAIYNQGEIQISNIPKDLINFDYKVINLNGQEVYHAKYYPNNENSSLKIPIILNEGTYILWISDGTKNYSSKFIVVN